ncbi:MAG: carbon-nitrogen hydrolase family protein [Pseudobdellovibrionaceae bacterium]
MNSKLTIAVCQMTSVDDVDLNFQQMEFLLNSISKPFDLAFFPENCLYMRLKEGEKIEGLSLEAPIFTKLGEIAKKKQVTLHLGSVPLKDNGKLANASVTVFPDGKAKCTYKKVHLFDIALEGQKPIRESDVFSHGGGPSLLEAKDWKIGQTICYDVRFAELYSYYAKLGVDLIVVPAAFLVKTGQAHWEVLLRARAIESQCYVAAAAQAGTHHNRGNERKTYGHSVIISPWGDILAKASSDRPEVLLLDLDKFEIEKVRKQIPMQSHRRL